MGSVDSSLRKAAETVRFQHGTSQDRLPRWIAYSLIGAAGISFYAGAAILIWAWLSGGI